MQNKEQGQRVSHIIDEEFVNQVCENEGYTSLTNKQWESFDDLIGEYLNEAVSNCLYLVFSETEKSVEKE